MGAELNKPQESLKLRAENVLQRLNQKIELDKKIGPTYAFMKTLLLTVGLTGVATAAYLNFSQSAELAFPTLLGSAVVILSAAIADGISDRALNEADKLVEERDLITDMNKFVPDSGNN